MAAFVSTLALLVPVILTALLVWKLVPFRWLKSGLITFCGAFCVWQLYYCWEDATGRAAERHYQQVKQVLATPRMWIDSSRLNGEQSIIALSLLGEGLVNYSVRFPAQRDEARQLTENALLALISPEGCPFENIRDTVAWRRRDDNLYLSHLNLLLGSYTQQLRADQANPYTQLHAQLSRHLAARLQAAPTRNAPSYGTTPDSLWVADNAVTLQSLFLRDALCSTAGSASLQRQWIHFIDSTGSTAKGLPFSELTRRRPPRGCANAWIGKYAAAYAPAFSADLWKKHKQDFKYNLGVASLFREYPPGYDLPADYDSGPMVLGVGASATGLALVGAKYQADYYTYYQLINSIKVAELAARMLTYCSHNDEWTQASGGWLSQAIQFSATARI
ncbi:hypothetical protein SAMN04515668_2506 [Hymenobacter arizonensis]|uniref:Uncharacterized protein n=2 Tax=Hymenobacter arizonensis TaxID=1227077 RepID=A0A1I5YXA1_HYMAR|nr:hypothetical protein SAMN04515668_2506 [Hymenobacter arizonensis]